MSVAVFGSTGGVGKDCVAKLLAHGHSVIAVARNPSKAQEKFPSSSKLEIRKGDVTDEAAIKSCVAGSSYVIFAATCTKFRGADDIDNLGVARVATAAKEAGVKQVILVSSAIASRKHRFHPVRAILSTVVSWGLMDAKWSGECALRESGVPYTIVRPGRLDDKTGGNTLIVDQGDKGSTQLISRADVAAMCVAAVGEPSARNVTFELFGKQPPQPPAGSQDDHLKELLRTLKPDQA